MEKTETIPRAVSARHAEREPAPSDVWDWQAYGTWRDVIWQLLADVIDDSVRQAFLDAPPEYVVGDYLDWLDSTIERARGLEVDSKELLADRLQRHFRAIRAVHGTRTSDLASYYTKGLLPLDPESIHARARAIFLSGEFPELSEDAVRRAIADVGTDLRDRRVFFDGNERMLVEECGHYLLYGSEYLIAIAAHLGNGRDYRQVLKRFGQPTVFVCDVPLKMIHPSWIAGMAGSALAAVFQELLDGEDYVVDQESGAGFCIHQPLGPEWIVGHFHPDVRRDPLLPSYE